MVSTPASGYCYSVIFPYPNTGFKFMLFVCLFVVVLLLLLLSFLFLHLVTVFVSFFNSFNLFYFKSVTINTDIVAIYLHGALTTITCPSMHHPLGTVIERTDLKIAHNNIKVHVYTSTNGQE